MFLPPPCFSFRVSCFLFLVSCLSVTRLHNSIVQQFNNSTLQQFNSSTIQQFNASTVQRFSNSTLQQFNAILARTNLKRWTLNVKSESSRNLIHIIRWCNKGFFDALWRNPAKQIEDGAGPLSLVLRTRPPPRLLINYCSVGLSLM